MTESGEKDRLTGDIPHIDLGKASGEVSADNLAFLRGLIDSFNVSTSRLQAAYDALREKVESLNLELERKNADLSRSLAEQERLSNYLTNILESLSSGVLVIDDNGVITLFNSGAASITGVSIEDAVNRPYREVMIADIPDELTPLGTLATGRGQSQFEKSVLTRWGAKVPVGCSISPLCNSQGDMIGAVEVFMDMSRIKSFEEELARKEKLAALGQMAATMAHKIRNPLGGIAGFAGLLNMEFKDSANGRRLVGKITEGVDKLERIVTSLLSYTAPMTLEYRSVDLVTLVGHAVSSLDAEEHGVGISVTCPDGSLIAEIDAERFRKMIQSLLRNAFEAVADGGAIDVFIGDEMTDFGDIDSMTSRVLDSLKNETANTRRLSSRAVIVIRDTGTGMDKHSKEQLFVPFYTSKENGIGLGLAHARKIVEGHLGTIAIESEEGNGTAAGIAVPRRRIL